jgi:hypothetical protein
MPKALLAFFVLLVLIAAAAAQSAEPAGRVLHVRRIEDSAIHVDGKLDEPVWKTIEPITNFTQTQPEEGAPVSQRTEAYVFYDERNIYFGFRFYDDPDKVLGRMAGHDTPTGSDSADILLDTFHDHRTAYWFSISAGGVMFDGTMDESRTGGGDFGSMDLSWDGIWYAARSRESWGWSAEVVIPFKSIRISDAARQEWGINIAREIMRRNEFAYMVPVPRFEGFMKPSRTATMVLDGVHVGRNLELIPFVSFAQRYGGGQPQLVGSKGNGGLDARYGLSANLTANLAINPDFGETEADEFTSQISRFEIFYPEKRKFFTEGAGYFQTLLDLFFSRRVGARMPDGEPQRILQGGKITGKTGRWTLGALEAVTQGRNFIDPSTQTLQTAPGAFFGVVRVQHDIFQKSAIGFISVNRRQGRGDAGQNESSHGVDLSILSGPHFKWMSQAMVNLNDAYPGVNGQHLGWGSGVYYDSDQFAFGGEGKFLGREVDISHTGFEPETDRWSGDLYTTWKPFINRYGIRQLFLEANYDESNGTRGELEDAGADGDFRVQFQNFWTAHLRYSFNRVRFYGFAPDFQRLSTTHVYETPSYVLELSSNNSSAVTFTASFQTQKMVQYNENFYGSLKRLQLNATARLGNHLRWQLNAIQVDESLANGAHFQYRRFFISRWFYQFNQKTRARVLAQFAKDRHGNNLSVNSLFAYDFTPRSALYIGYNRQQRRPLDPGDLGNQFFVKLSYLFAF